MTPAMAGIIGRDLLLRREQLHTPEFHLAAYLASHGEAGNDGVLDFADCVSILPQESYQSILFNHDLMAEMPVLQGFDEFSFLAQIEEKFDAEFGEEGEGLLSYLVLCDDPQRDRSPSSSRGAHLMPPSSFLASTHAMGIC